MFAAYNCNTDFARESATRFAVLGITLKEQSWKEAEHNKISESTPSISASIDLVWIALIKTLQSDSILMREISRLLAVVRAERTARASAIRGEATDVQIAECRLVLSSGEDANVHPKPAVIKFCKE